MNRTPRNSYFCRQCRQASLEFVAGLCSQCFEAFAATFAAPDPDAPTEALPGSPEKILTMEVRERQERELFHPHDASRGLG